MAAPVQPDTVHELAELRARAYGPDADIVDDPVALARLVELESLASRRHGSVAAAAVALDDESTPITALDSRVGPSSQPAAVEDAATVRPQKKPSRAIFAVSVTVALGLVAVGSSVLTPPSDVTLHQRTEIPQAAITQLGTVGELRYLGIRPHSVRLYDEYQGLNVWSARRGIGTTCLFITAETPPRWRVDCTPSTGEPTIDLVRYRDGSRLAGFESIGDVPVGSIRQLVLRNGAVIARVVEASLPDDVRP
jgi:hypothetical protein